MKEILHEEYDHRIRGEHCIFKLIHKETGRAYIGRTSQTIRGRVGNLRRGTHKSLMDALQEGGIQDFDWEILYTGSLNNCSARLPQFISSHATLIPHGYNQTITPSGSNKYASTNWTQESRGRARERAMKTKLSSKGHGQKLGRWVYSKKHGEPSVRLLDMLRQHPEGITIKQLMADLKLSYITITSANSYLRSKGYQIVSIFPPGRGLHYRLEKES